MNIEKMEKSAKEFVDKPTALNHTKFIQAANPAAILALIERVRELEFALNHIASWAGISAGLRTFKDTRAYAKYNVAKEPK